MMLSIPILSRATAPPPPAPPAVAAEEVAATEAVEQGVLATIVKQNRQYYIRREAKGILITDSTGRSTFIPYSAVPEIMSNE